MPAAPQEDAALMMAASTTTTTSSKTKGKNNGSANAASSSGSDALARSNLLRLEASELLRESYLHVHPTGDASHAHYEAKWAPNVRSYMEDLKGVLGGLGEATLGPNVALLPAGGKGSGDGAGDEEVNYRIPLLSDKFTKSTSGSSKGGGDSNNPLTSWSFPFPGGTSLSVHPVGSFAHAGNAGLANKHANGIGGDVLPVLDVAILVDNKDDAFVGGKDYLNHRYADKRNILAVHIAKQLSQKKHRAKVGAVHLTHVFGDSRKVGLVLTPPSESSSDGDNSTKDKKKRKRGNEKSKGKKKGGKPRFRIRLLFGVKQDGQSNPDSSKDDEYSTDEESAADALVSSWIPKSRLLPNRNNNRSTKLGDGDNADSTISTPHYTNSLAEDLHLLSTTDLIDDTLSMLTSSANNVTPTSAFHETLLLIKVWALQRGFLRGHDTFTTTTLAVILVYLYRTKAIGKRMGCVQGFIAFMKFWSENDWLGEDTESIATSANGQSSGSAAATRERKMKKKAAFVVPSDGRNESQTVSQCAQALLYLDDVRGSHVSTPKTLLDCYKAVYTSSSSSISSISNNGQHVDSPILLDPSMTLNYLARLSPSFVRESRSEAYAALRYIHGQESGASDVGAFKKLFLETNRFWTRYDAYVRIPLSVVPKMLGGVESKKKKKHGKGGSSEAAKVWGNDIDDLGYDESVCRGIVEVISRALGDRATAVRAFTCGNGNSTAIAGSSESKDSNEDVATKLIVDSEQSHAVPIRGSNSTNSVYAAKLEERFPTPPAAASANTKEEACLVVGLRIDPNASRRIVDRGPPAEDVEGSSGFVSLWGEKAAQLRRFQDGAIVRAVVWNDAASTGASGKTVQFCGMDRSMGGIVERIAAHIVKLHFTDVKKQKKSHLPKSLSPVGFELRNMVSLIDGVVPSSSPQQPASPSPFADSLSLHKNVMTAFNSLSEFLRDNTKNTFENISMGKVKKTSKLGLPLSIDEVEPLSPCLRYSALFPPVPHPLLGGTDLAGEKKVSGVNAGSPVLIQIRFSSTSKWPASLNAMGAAKCAMLVQLADGIDKMKQESGGGELDAFDGPMDVTPNYLDVSYLGFSWRIIVRADQELRMLQGLRNPNDEAKTLQLNLINRHVRGAMHHSLINAIHTRHPSASSVVRLAHRWVASHMLSDMIPTEALELMVAKIYTESAESGEEAKSNNKSKMAGPNDTPPSTVVAGFLRFLQLLSTHDWAREPLIVDPQSHISPTDRSLIQTQFKVIRGGTGNRNNGPAMYMISPADYDGVEDMVGSMVVGDDAEQAAANNMTEKVWAPNTTAQYPERVVLSRAVALAKCSHMHLTSCIMNGNDGGNNDWVAAFQESSASLTSYSALLRVDPSFVIDQGCSSTSADCAVGDAKSELMGPFEKSLRKRYAGPKELRKKHFKNLVLEKDTLHEWQPVKSLVKALRSKYGDYAVFFYNELAPDVIALIWRPDAFDIKPQPFSAIVSEFKRPVAEYWKGDSLVMANTDDLMAEIGYFSRSIVSNFKVFDDKKPNDTLPEKKRSKKEAPVEDDSDGSSDSEEE